MKRSFLMAAVVPLALLLAVPQGARASLDLGSSMTATCVGLDCTTVRFDLSVTGDNLVKTLVLESDGSPWGFGGLVNVLDADGTDVTSDWSSGVSSDELEMTASNLSGYSAEPLVVTVDMTASGTEAELHEAENLAYWGSGKNSDGEETSFGGTVTPEPISTVLIGTGLAGIAGMAGRKKRNLLDDEQEET